MADDPRTQTVTFDGHEVEIKLNAGCFRLAELKGYGLSKEDIQGSSNFALGCRLVYMALALQLDDDVSEGEVMEWLVDHDNANELVGWAVAQFHKAEDVLGKSLGFDREQMIRQILEEKMDSSTS